DQSQRVVHACAERRDPVPMLDLVERIERAQRETADHVQRLARRAAQREPRDEDHEAARGFEREQEAECEQERRAEPAAARGSLRAGLDQRRYRKTKIASPLTMLTSHVTTNVHVIAG